MIKKRLLCILLTICLLIPMSLPTYAASESNELKNVTLSLYSNLSPERYISGLYRDNTFYITLEDLCALTRGKIVKETEEEAVVGFGNCRNGKSIREFVIDVGSGNMAEPLYSDEYNITLPSLAQDGKVYVSALHFLRYLGATVKLQEDSPIQFMIIKRYDIFDALSDLINSDLGNFFWWDEVDTGEENLEDKLTNAGVIALINRDSNIFRMMFDAKGIEQEALEDALLSIVKNEGQGYFTENSAESELIDTASSIIGAEADWFDLIKEAYADGSDVLGDQISDLASSAAITAGFANNVIGAFESLKQFDNMSSSQRNLLEKTVLQYPEDSKTLCDGWNVVFDAAKNVSGKIQSEYDAQYKAALDVAESTAYDFLNGATGAAGANPVSIAWSGVTLLTKMIPFTNEMIEKKVQLYNSYNCSIIQLIANEMLVEAYSDWYYGNALYTGSAEQYKKLDSVKQLIVLQLKSTLTTREYLINSGFLERNYASEMKEMNQETAILLNKAENCQINGVDLFSVEYENDISWIENYETGKADLAMVYAGNSTTSIIDANGNLLICGNNGNGQLGGEIPGNKATYSLVASNIKFVCGSSSFAAISTDDKLFTWGYNGYEQLGNGRNYDINPELVQIADNIIDVSITSSVCAYVTRSGELYAMGYPRSSFGDDANTRSSNEPVKIMDNIKNIELSSNLDYGTIFAGITNSNELYMWGSNSNGIINPDRTNDVIQPTKIMDNIKMVSLGKDYVLALTTNNELYAWGNNNLGQLGVDSIADVNAMVKVMDDVVFTDAGNATSLAITENGDLYTWGYNSHGCLGIGADPDINQIAKEPTKVMSYVRAASIDGATMSILTQNGDVYTCGWNVEGQLGTGTFDDTNIPVKVYNVYNLELPETLQIENAEVVNEEYFDKMDDVLISTEGNGQNVTINMTIDHLSDFIKYNGGKIKLQLSDGNVALMFEYEVEDDVAAPTGNIFVLTEKNGSISWMGATWKGINCEQNGDVLSWDCTLPQGSFSFEEIKYVGISVHTSRSRLHVTTYELDGDEIRRIDTPIEQMKVAVPSAGGYHQYIE